MNPEKEALFAPIKKLEKLPQNFPYPEPKYDPCRLFKAGDKVRVVEYKGRNNSGVEAGKIGTVDGNEFPNDVESIEVVFEGDDLWGIDPAYLELVQPVEELEPYFVQENRNVVEVLSIEDKEVPATVFFKSKHKNARERAEAECARLNAEYRKEQE